MSDNIGNDTGTTKSVSAGKSTGLYHLIIGGGQNAFVANGKKHQLLNRYLNIQPSQVWEGRRY